MIISCALRTLYLPEVTQNTVLCILSPGLLLWDKCWGKEKIICIPFSQVCFYRLWQPLCKPSAGARETSWGATARVEQGQALAPVHEDTHLQAASGSGVTGRSAPKPKWRFVADNMCHKCERASGNKLLWLNVGRSSAYTQLCNGNPEGGIKERVCWLLAIVKQ